MRKIFILIGFLLLLSFSPQNDSNEKVSVAQMEKSEAKEFLLSYFEKTAQELEDEVKELTPEQMQYKASPESWSVSQNLEHIILTEEEMFSMVRELLEKPANPERKEEVEINDQEVIQNITDRSMKVETTEELQPVGMYATPKDALSDFEALRMVIVDYVENSDVEFRDFISDSPYGPMDTYQSLLFIAGHTDRHTQQIVEVKNSSGFPE